MVRGEKRAAAAGGGGGGARVLLFFFLFPLLRAAPEPPASPPRTCPGGRGGRASPRSCTQPLNCSIEPLRQGSCSGMNVSCTPTSKAKRIKRLSAPGWVVSPNSSPLSTCSTRSEEHTSELQSQSNLV